jgi:DNA polymerase beta
MDRKSDIVSHLMKMHEESVEKKDTFRIKAYKTVLDQLKKVPKISSFADVVHIPGIGKSIKQKIEDIISNKIVVNTNTKTTQQSIEDLTAIMCIGPVKARDLVKNHNIDSITTLLEHTDLLNDKQKMGLKYHEDISKRIPRAEMDKHNNVIGKVIQRLSPDARYEIAGSYRRGLSNSGDIDVLITHPTNTNLLAELVAELTAMNYLADDFAHGAQKYMGVGRLPRHKSFRRIDILYIPIERFAFALLYFTGSQKFNIKMRQHALGMGYSLNEHGIKLVETDTEVTHPKFHTEQDIFKFLNLPWAEPTDRSL